MDESGNPETQAEWDERKKIIEERRQQLITTPVEEEHEDAAADLRIYLKEIWDHTADYHNGLFIIGTVNDPNRTALWHKYENLLHAEYIFHLQLRTYRREYRRRKLFAALNEWIAHANDCEGINADCDIPLITFTYFNALITSQEAPVDDLGQPFELEYLRTAYNTKKDVDFIIGKISCAMPQCRRSRLYSPHHEKIIRQYSIDRLNYSGIKN
jgi:hypothetical protein